MKKLILFILMTSVIIAQETNNQEDKTYTFLRAGYQAGSVLQTSEFLQPLRAQELDTWRRKT